MLYPPGVCGLGRVRKKRRTRCAKARFFQSHSFLFYLKIRKIGRAPRQDNRDSRAGGGNQTRYFRKPDFHHISTTPSSSSSTPPPRHASLTSKPPGSGSTLLLLIIVFARYKQDTKFRCSLREQVPVLHREKNIYNSLKTPEALSNRKRARPPFDDSSQPRLDHIPSFTCVRHTLSLPQPQRDFSAPLPKAPFGT